MNSSFSLSDGSILSGQRVVRVALPPRLLLIISDSIVGLHVEDMRVVGFVLKHLSIGSLKHVPMLRFSSLRVRPALS